MGELATGPMPNSGISRPHIAEASFGEEIQPSRPDAIYTLARGLVINPDGSYSSAGLRAKNYMPYGGGALDGDQRAQAIDLLLRDPRMESLQVHVLGTDAPNAPYRTTLLGELQDRDIPVVTHGEAPFPNTAGELTQLAHSIEANGFQHIALVTGETQLPRLQAIMMMLEHANGNPTERAIDRFDALIGSLPSLFAQFKDPQRYAQLVAYTTGKHSEEQRYLAQNSATTQDLLALEQRAAEELYHLHVVHYIANHYSEFLGEVNPNEAADHFLDNYAELFRVDLRELLTQDSKILETLGQTEIEYKTCEGIFAESQGPDAQVYRRYASLLSTENNQAKARTLASDLFGVALMLSPVFEYPYYQPNQIETVQRHIPASQVA